MSNNKKELQRQKIADQTKAYLEKGGEIETVNPGVTEEFKKEFRRKMKIQPKASSALFQNK